MRAEDSQANTTVKVITNTPAAVGRRPGPTQTTANLKVKQPERQEPSQRLVQANSKLRATGRVVSLYRLNIVSRYLLKTPV